MLSRLSELIINRWSSKVDNFDLSQGLCSYSFQSQGIKKEGDDVLQKQRCRQSPFITKEVAYDMLCHSRCKKSFYKMFPFLDDKSMYMHFPITAVANHPSPSKSVERGGRKKKWPRIKLCPFRNNKYLALLNTVCTLYKKRRTSCSSAQLLLLLQEAIKARCYGCYYFCITTPNG